MKIKKNGEVIRLSESDLKRIVKIVLTEQEENVSDEPTDKPNIRRQRFLRVAPKMVNDTLTNIRRMNRLAQKSNYLSTPDEIKQIINALTTEIKKLEKVLLNKNDETGFTLKPYMVFRNTR